MSRSRGRRTAAWVAGVLVLGVAAAPGAGATGIGFAIVRSPNPAGAQGSYLGGVSCSSSTACASVGHKVDSSGVDHALAELWNGAGWRDVPVQVPAGATSSELFKVSCTAATACLAVGRYALSDGVDRPLAEKWDGEAWTDAGAVPSGAAGSSFDAVSCTAPTDCTAVGYDLTAPAGDALIEHWDGSAWTILAAVAPAGQFPILTAVSCTAANACVAVGEYAGATHEQTLGERWNGVRWTLTGTRNHSGTEASYLDGIVCTAATSCIAVGNHSPSPGVAKVLVETLTGTTWKLVGAQTPSGATYSSLIGVACASSTSCIAVGSDARIDSDGKAFAEDWNGTAWTLDKVVHAHGTTGDYLNGAYCPTAGPCTFAGGYSTNTSVDRTLIEVATPPAG